jgi:hypothetical protein
MGLGIKEIRCESWPDFKKEIIEQHYPDGKFKRGRFLFRGQGGGSWSLSSSFDRWYKGYQGERANKVRIADQLLRQFGVECELEDLPGNVRNDKIMMLSLGQHNGLPTRMLDWSESPYVAAFFAFSGHVRHGVNLEKHVAIWVLDSTADIWHSEHGCEIVNVPSFGNERIRNQHGKFTYLKAPIDSLEEYVEQFKEETTRLWRYLVPVSNVAAAMADLDAMGLNHARIYPGLTGNAKSAEVRVILDMKNP